MLFFQIQAETELEVEAGGLVLEVVAQTTTVVEVVLHARFGIEAQLRQDIVLKAYPTLNGELQAVAIEMLRHTLGSQIRLDVVIGLSTSRQIDVQTTTMEQLILRIQRNAQIMKYLFLRDGRTIDDRREVGMQTGVDDA